MMSLLALSEAMPDFGALIGMMSPQSFLRTNLICGVQDASLSLSSSSLSSSSPWLIEAGTALFWPLSVRAPVAESSSSAELFGPEVAVLTSRSSGQPPPSKRAALPDMVAASLSTSPSISCFLTSLTMSKP